MAGLSTVGYMRSEQGAPVGLVIEIGEGKVGCTDHQARQESTAAYLEIRPGGGPWVEPQCLAVHVGNVSSTEALGRSEEELVTHAGLPPTPCAGKSCPLPALQQHTSFQG